MTGRANPNPAAAALRLALAKRVLEAVDARRDELVALSLAIHDQPEVAYQEYKAASRLSGFLETSGFRVTRGYCGVETAYRADASGSDGGPTIAILTEFDALPEIGHGCGHNLIAMMGTAAAIGTSSVLGDLSGRIAAIGTPAEEGGGGKVALIRAGGFDDVDAAMLVHPSTRTLARRATLAANRVDVEFFGKAAHAAAQPHDGISALDGVLQLFSNINAMRLTLKPDARVHGIISDGGKAANVIPDHAAAKFSVRALDRQYQQEVLERFTACVKAAALATRAEYTITVQPNAGYENMVASTPIALRWERHMIGLGQRVDEASASDALGSTDMGNVSQIIPAIQPYVAIGRADMAFHSVVFREAARTPEAHEAALQAARAMALTVLDLLIDSHLLEEARSEFSARRDRGEVKGLA